MTGRKQVLCGQIGQRRGVFRRDIDRFLMRRGVALDRVNARQTAQSLLRMARIGSPRRSGAPDKAEKTVMPVGIAPADASFEGTCGYTSRS